MTEDKDQDSVLMLQERWDKIRIANVFDALDKAGYPDQTIDLGIRPLLPTQHLAGKAVTVRGRKDPRSRQEIEATTPEEGLGMAFGILRRQVFPGSVIVIDGAGEPYTGKFGEMTSWMMKQVGAKGIVIDGCIRDYLGIIEIPDFTVCVRNTSPIESFGRWAFSDINVPIGMPGTLTDQVRVDPGDWIIGGDDGVIVVPEEISLDILIEAEDMEEREEGMRRDLAAGVSFSEAYRKWGRA